MPLTDFLHQKFLKDLHHLQRTEERKVYHVVDQMILSVTHLSILPILVMDLKLKKVNIMINIFFQKPDFHTGSKNNIIEPKVYYKKYIEFCQLDLVLMNSETVSHISFNYHELLDISRHTHPPPNECSLKSYNTYMKHLSYMDCFDFEI